MDYILYCEGVSIGGEAACYIIEKHLSRFIEGQVSLDQNTIIAMSITLKWPLPPARSHAI